MAPSSGGLSRGDPPLRGGKGTRARGSGKGREMRRDTGRKKKKKKRPKQKAGRNVDPEVREALATWEEMSFLEVGFAEAFMGMQLKGIDIENNENPSESSRR